ncbi:hypothetical protein [Neobacillus mesonae]|uniref:hypothetical protein n=1 Tax=Neobacillus mesonae TaxID=1193713 RepID=UPI002572BA3C|nr:hypothetical protein [Neobacillus mesonae]
MSGTTKRHNSTPYGQLVIHFGKVADIFAEVAEKSCEVADKLVKLADISCEVAEKLFKPADIID